MSKCQVTLTANSGVLIECKGMKVCCDAFHDDKATEFSTVSPEMEQQIISLPAFLNPDMIFYTHKHRDHYTRPAAARACSRSPGALLVTPMQELNNSLYLHADSHHLSLGGADFTFKQLRHSGEKYAELPNYGCLMNFDGFRVLILGDCIICNPHLTEWIKNTPVDLALLNFPWLTLRLGRTFVQNVIRPQHVMFYHLPFAGDDIRGYRETTAKNLPLFATPKDARVLWAPFQTETVD